MLGAVVGAVALSGLEARALAGEPTTTTTGAGTTAATSLSKVEPAEFGAGATITIAGAGFEDGDTVALDGVALEEVKVSATQITALVPAKAKAGKALLLKRGGKTLAKLALDKQFVAAPKLAAATPKFAAPGESVVLKGKGLDRVTALTIAGEDVKIEEQSATSIRFTAPAGKTGPLVVRGVGGEASLKKDYEIFYAPVLAAAEPAAGFEGDTIALKGEHLAAAKFKLGSKPLKAEKLEDAQATVTIAKGAKSGELRAEARKKGSAVAFTVHPTPALTTVPKEVGAPGVLKVSGKNLDAVETWRLGQVELKPEAPASKTKVALLVPAEATSDQVLVAVAHGKEFAGKKPVTVLKSPLAEALAFWPAATGVEGQIRGRDFAAVTKFTLAGKPLKTTFVDANTVGFALAAAPAADLLELSAKTGKIAGPPLSVDGAAGGYGFGPAKLDVILAAGGDGYGPTAIALDLEVSQRQPDRGRDSLRGLGGLAHDAEGQARVAQLGKQIGLDLRRFTVAQVALCRGMAAGKTREGGDANAAPGEQLRATQRQLGALAGQLVDLWSQLPAQATAPGAASGLAEVDAEVAAAIAARAKVDAACKGKFIGGGKLTSEATQVAHVELDKSYKQAMLGGFAAPLALGKSWAAVEADITARLAALPAARRKVWLDALKASKGAVEGKASVTTGKGARGDKHVEPQDKPKGKGKAK